jgi:hypothetical protein
MTLPLFVKTNWSAFLNTKPKSVIYWIAFIITVLSVVMPQHLDPLVLALAPFGADFSKVQMIAGIITAGMYAKYQLRAL